MALDSLPFEPARIVDIELSQPIQPIGRTVPGKDLDYGRMRALIRLHGNPLLSIDSPLGADGLSAEQMAALIWERASADINAHLQADNLPTVQSLPVTGLTVEKPETLACLRDRRELLANPPFVSVVLCTRNRPDLCGRMLKSLLAQEYPKFEIIVVDNNPPNEATAELVQREFSAYPTVRYVRENRPGLSAARNCGIDAAKGEYIAFTDDDLIIDKYWLADLVACFRRGPNVGCVSGLVFPLELDTQPQDWFEQYGGFGKGYALKIYDTREHRLPGWTFPYSAGIFGTGAAMVFRAAALKKIGNFDPALGTGTVALGGEDLAIFFEIIRHGYQLIYQPRSVAFHQHRRDYPGLKKQMYGYGVGLTAYLTKIILDSPWRLLDIAWRIPGGLYVILSPRSHKHQHKTTNYPVELTLEERRGVVAGPWAYLRSWWQARRYRAKSQPLSGKSG